MTEDEGSFHFCVINIIQLNLLNFFTDALFSLIKLACGRNINIWPLMEGFWAEPLPPHFGNSSFFFSNFCFFFLPLP